MVRDWTTPESWTDQKAINTTRLQAISTQLTWLYEMMFAKEGTALTIASGVITVTGNEAFYKVSGQGGAADELVTINGGTDGDIIILSYDGEAITVRHGTGNIDCGDYDNIVMDAVGNNVMVRREGANWKLLSTNVHNFETKDNGIGEEPIYYPIAGLISQAGSEPDGLEKLDCGAICHWGVPFDDSVNEILNFNLLMPKRYDKASCHIAFVWTTKSGGSAGNVYWSGGLKTLDDGDSLGTAGGGNSIVDAWQGNLKFHITSFVENSSGSFSATDDIVFIEGQIYRNATHASDTLSGDAYLLGIAIRWTSDQETDD